MIRNQDKTDGVLLTKEEAQMLRSILGRINVRETLRKDLNGISRPPYSPEERAAKRKEGKLQS